MANSTGKVLLKKRGRPATGNDPMMAFRMPQEMKYKIDEWADHQPDNPPRSEAIRRLIDLGLTVKQRR
jgi:hypothetical protein